MPIESLPSPIVSEAVQGLELALARVVAQVRAEFAMERRAAEAELKVARAEYSAIVERLDAERTEFRRFMESAAITERELNEQRLELRGEPGPAGSDGVPGRDGAEGTPGRDGRDGLPGVAGAQGERGRDGTDGKDGLGFQSARQVEDGEHFSIEFLSGEEVIRKFTFRKPTLADFHCGPYRNGETYRRGQCATYGGSTFLCLRETTKKPETEDWQLIVKHGLPGRNGKDGERGAPGPQGPPGRDLTQLAGDGRKYG